MAAGNSYCLGIKSNDFFLKDNKKAFILWLNVPKVTAYPYLQCRSLHTNIVVPTLYEMGDLAEIIHQLIKNGEQIYISEQEQKECFYNAVKADEIEMDFNDWKNQNFRKALAEMEGIYGQIDFSQLQNAKDSKKKKKK